MKKITLLLIFSVLLNFTINAQDYDISEITSKISKTYNSGCISKIKVEFDTPTLLKGHPNYSWRDYYYKLEIELYGHNLNGSNQLLDKITKITTDYITIGSRSYVYRNYFSIDGFDLSNFDYVHSKLKIHL